MEGERSFTPGESPLTSTGGVPFLGNVYVGRADTASYTAPKQGGSGLLNRESLWDNPAVRQKITQCPYFALCDQVMYLNMDPAYLDPGVLTAEEHHLMLLFSRAYYEKWKEIHRRPANGFANIRIKYGSTRLLDEMASVVGIPTTTMEVLKKEYLLDDAPLIAMNPRLWSTAYLDPANMDQLSGRVLEFADVPEHTQERFFKLLDQMRRIVVVRRDGRNGEEEQLVLPFTKGMTLYDLYHNLGLKPYTGQLKVYKYLDTSGTPQTKTLNNEDAYFDYLVNLFYKSDLGKATLSDVADDTDNTCRYSIIVEPFTVPERRIGRWF